MHYTLLFLFLVLSACNNSGEKVNDNSNVDSASNDTTNLPLDSNEAIPSDITGCYMRILGRDTMVANLVHQGSTVSGKIYFDNYEKDGSRGTVRGTVQDSTCRLVYDFHAEGMKSVMDVHFLIKKEGIIRGIGEMEVRGDTAAYKQPGSLSYPANEIWKQVACENLPSAFRQ